MANRFWVGGTGTWDASDTTHWAATSGTAGGQSVPGSGDTATFDGSSGGGTVTVDTTVAIQSLTCGAHTGTLDFSANNNNVTLTASAGFNGSGTGTRTLNLGNGTWTMSGAGTTPWDLGTKTNLTFSANSSTLVFTATTTTNRNFSGGALTYSTVSISANTSRGGFYFTAGNTFANLNLTAPNSIFFNTGTTTITNAFTWAGTYSAPLMVCTGNLQNLAIISVASGSPSINFAALRELTFSGGATFTAANSFDCGRVSGITITPPGIWASYGMGI